MYKIKYIYLKPLYYFIYIWVIFIILRYMPIVQWHTLHFETIIYLISIFIIIIVSYIIVALYISNKKSLVLKVDINYKKLKKLYFYLLFFSVFSLILIVLKFYFDTLTYDSYNITELRYAKMSDTRRSSSLISVFATMFSGFMIVFYIFTYWYREYLPKSYYQISAVFFIFFLLSTLLSGGRNGMFISLLMVFLAIKYKNIFRVRKISKYSFKRIFIILSIVMLFLYITSVIFLERMELRERTLITSFEYIASAYNIEFNQYLINLLNIEIINIVIFLFLFLFFYLMHSLDQFDVAFMSPVGNLFPYLGAMTFYPVVQLLNKLGFSIVPIDIILKDIVNPGNYTTLFGPLYFDFNIFGSYIFIFMIIVVYIYNYSIFLKKKSFISYMIIILISISFLLSPIYSFFTLGVFFPIVFALLIFYIISKFIKVDSYQIFEKRNYN